VPALLDVVATPAHVAERLLRALDEGVAALAPNTLAWEPWLCGLAARWLPTVGRASAEVERLTLAAAVRAVLPRYDAAFGERADTVDAFARSLEVLRTHGVSAEVLLAAQQHTAADDAGTRARLGLLAAVLEEHTTRLDALGLVASASLEGRIAEAIEASQTSGQAPQEGATRLRLWHLQSLSPTRVRLLLALARQAGISGGRVEVQVACEPRRERLPLTLDRALRAFEADERSALEMSYGLRDADAAPVDAALAPWLLALAEGGRAHEPTRVLTPGSARRPVSMAEAEGPEEEARWVAAQVAALLDTGIGADDIAIVLRRADAATVARIGRCFDDAGVAWSPPAPGPAWLLDSALARALLGLPRALARGAMREDVLRLLAVLLGNGARGHELGPLWRVAQALRSWGIATLFDSELEARCDYQVARHNASPTTAASVKRLAELLWQQSKDGTVAEHCARLRGWVPRMGGEGRFYEESLAVVSQVAADPGASVILRALGRDEAALAACVALLDALPAMAAAAGRTGAISVGEFGELVLDLARVWRARDAQGGAGAVSVLEAHEAVGRSFAVVMLPGMVDGAFPAHRRDEALWGDAERAAVAKALGFPIERTGAREAETLLLLGALAAATERVYASAHRHDDAGRALAPSPFFGDLQRTSGAVVERLGRDPLARSQRVPPRGVERTLRALSGAARSRQGVAAPVLAALASAESRARIERARETYFARPEVEGDAHHGRIDHDAALVDALALPRWASASRPLDVTLLERVARCGYKAFAHYVLRIEERVDDNTALDDKQRGHLLHELVQVGAESLVATRGEDPDARWQAVEAALEEKFAEFSERLARLDLGLVEADYRAVRRQAEAWLQRRMGDPSWRMLETEIGFGPQSSWPSVVVTMPDGAEPVSLRGRIDGVERVGAVVRAVEFKSGRGDGYRRRLQDGALDTQFQLVVYAAAVERARRAGRLPSDCTTVDGVYVGFRDLAEHTLRDALGGDGRKRLPRYDVDALVADGAVGEGALGDAVRRVVGPLRAGRFEPRPRDCNFCQYRPLCRVESHDVMDDESDPSGTTEASP
jgi:hypothetical protein